MRKPSRLAALATALSLGLGSGAALGSPAPTSGRGGSVALDRAALRAYVADADNAALHQVDLSSGEVVTTILPCAPEQVALLGGERVAVSLRGCNKVAILAIDLVGEGTVVASVDVAAEPWGLAVTPEGDLLVTSGWGHALALLDGETLAEKFAIDLPREPRSVTVTPDGRRAFVTHAVGDAISAVDLEPTAAHEPPSARRLAVLGGRYRNRVDRAIGAGTLHPAASLAFAAVLSESGTRLFVPHLAVQNGSDTARAIPGAYGGVPLQEDTSVPAVAVLGVGDEQLLLPGPAAEGPERAVHIGVGASFAVAPAGARSRQMRAAAVLDDRLYVTSYGTGELVELDARSLDPAMTELRRFEIGDGPAGVDVDPLTHIAVVYSRFAHRLSVVSLASGGVESIPVGADPLSVEVAAGRRLFHAEVDARISRDGRACAGCHPEGREDGLVWKLGMGPRQTPMLVGRLDRGAYGWLGKHPTLEGNVGETIGRLGGTGLPARELGQLVAYLRAGLVAPQRATLSPALASRVARGKELFESEAVGCGGCHELGNGTSDRKAHDVSSRAKVDQFAEFRTPPLLFVGGTAPYFHDGRYPTLEALLDDNLDRMGSTSQLSDPDRGALLAFVRTL